MLSNIISEHAIKYFFLLLLCYSLSFILIKHYLESGEKYPNLYNSLKGAIVDSIFDHVQNTDAFIISSYYYPKSRSLGENSLAMVLLLNRNTIREITKYRMTLVASNETDSVLVIPKLQKEVYSSCAYVNVVARTNLLPGLKKLEIVEGTTRFEISFRNPREMAPSPVIICLTPQFLSEQWQLFVTQAHVARRFGGHLHLYVISMVDTYFQLVKEYEKHGYVTVDYWIRPKFANSPNSLEPNANMEWRNQAGGHTDCLLQYKESASFVTFFDMDDVLLPRGFNSYYDEFAFLSFTNPSIRTFHYDKREYLIYRETQLDQMNFGEMLGHTWYSPRVDTGKLMAKPSDLDSVWIHQSYNTKDRERLFLKDNFITHLQKPKDRNTTEIPIMKVAFVEMKEFKRDKNVLASIQEDFKKMLESPDIESIGKTLQRENVFLPVMFNCYYDRYYGKSPEEQRKMCPNGEGCQIPKREDLKCVHSDAKYISGPKMNPITFHYYQNPEFLRNVECSH